MPRLPPPPLVGPLKTRVRAMRFAIWAASLDHVPSNAEVAEHLGIHLQQARRWRADWLEARGPVPAARVVKPFAYTASNLAGLAS